MTSIVTTGPLPLVRLPSRTELRLMMHQPKVIITAMVCVTVILLAFVGGITFLAATGKGTEALIGAVVTPIVAALVAVMARSREIGEKVKALEQAVVNSPNITTPERP